MNLQEIITTINDAEWTLTDFATMQTLWDFVVTVLLCAHLLGWM